MAFTRLSEHLSRAERPIYWVTLSSMRELRHMHLLESMVGVCSACKKVHDSRDGAWQPLETYLANHPEEFTHDLCPSCAQQTAEIYDRR